MTAAAASVSSSRGGRIRLGYCIDSFGIGGTELNAVRTLEALDQDQFQVTVFHLHEDGPLRPRYEALKVGMVHLPISSLYSPRTLLQGAAFGGMLRRAGIQVVHTHDLYTNIFAVPWARLVGGCRVLASRRWLYEAPHPGLVPLNRWSNRLATRILANSPSIVRLLRDEERVPADRIVEIPNFLEEQAFRRVDPGARVMQRRAWGIPDGAFLIGVVARLAPVKNHELLFRAAQQLGAPFHVALVGEGSARVGLVGLANELGIGARVHFLGEIISVTNLHQFFDASVLCSRSEGSPNSVIEALAVGRPVVATPVGGVTDVIENDHTGLLAPLDDPAALSVCILRLRASEELCNRLGEAGMQRVRSRYHVSIVMRQLMTLYRDLVVNSSPTQALPT